MTKVKERRKVDESEKGESGVSFHLFLWLLG
jgi:hypothetical protein